MFRFLLEFLREPDTEGSQSNIEAEQSLIEAFKEAFGYKSYLFLMAGFFVCGFQITLIATHVPKYVIERGLDGWTGAAILSLIGLFNIFGTLTMGYLADKYSKKLLLSGLYFLRGIIIILFLFLPASNTLAILFGICFGFLWLATIPATFGIVAQVFGTKYLMNRKIFNKYLKWIFKKYLLIICIFWCYEYLVNIIAFTKYSI